jgi:hypothetical protein
VTLAAVDRADETEIDAVENSRDTKQRLPDPGGARRSRIMDRNRFVGYSLSLNCRSTVVSTQQRPGELEWMNAFNGRVLLWIQFHAPDRPARCQAIGLRPEATTPSRAYTGGPPLTRFSLHEARKLKRCAGPGEPACLCMSDFQVPPRRIHNNSQGRPKSPQFNPDIQVLSSLAIINRR